MATHLSANQSFLLTSIFLSAGSSDTMANDHRGTSMTLWGKLPPWAVLGLIAILGLVLIAVPAVLEWR
jgi:hypothetical protein